MFPPGHLTATFRALFSSRPPMCMNPQVSWAGLRIHCTPRVMDVGSCCSVAVRLGDESLLLMSSRSWRQTLSTVTKSGPRDTAAHLILTGCLLHSHHWSQGNNLRALCQRERKSILTAGKTATSRWLAMGEGHSDLFLFLIQQVNYSYPASI